MAKKIKLNKNYKKKEKNIFEDGRLCKFLIVLYSKVYVLEKEFIKEHRFTKSEITKYSRILEDKQYIDYELLGNLDLHQQECILCTTDNFNKLDKENPTVYKITKTGLFECKNLITELLKLQDTHEVWYNTIRKLSEKGKARKSILKEIQEDEKNNYVRNLRLPNLTHIQVETKLVKEFRQQLLEKKADKLLLSNNTPQSNQLVISQNKNQLMQQLQKEQKEEFRNHIKKLDLTREDELLLKTQNVHISDKEVNKINKESEKEINNKIKDLYAETAHYENKDHLLEHTPVESTIGKYMLNKNEPVEEGLNFLDSLL